MASYSVQISPWFLSRLDQLALGPSERRAIAGLNYIYISSMLHTGQICQLYFYILLHYRVSTVNTLLLKVKHNVTVKVKHNMELNKMYKNCCTKCTKSVVQNLL